MSEFTAIRAVSLTLKKILETHITDISEPQLQGVGVDLRSPKEMREDTNNATGISLWLYQVIRNGDVLNRAPRRVASDQVVPSSLPINLYYLVTPITGDSEDEQALLGRVLQVFNDHPMLRGSDLEDSLKGGVEELRLTLEALSLEELTRVWNAVQEPYQLSVTYLVQVVMIDSDREPIQTAPVAVKEARYTQILDSF